MIVAGFGILVLGLVLFVGGRQQLPRGPTSWHEARRKAIHQSAWVMISIGAASLMLGLALRA